MKNIFFSIIFVLTGTAQVSNACEIKVKEANDGFDQIEVATITDATVVKSDHTLPMSWDSVNAVLSKSFGEPQAWITVTTLPSSENSNAQSFELLVCPGISVDFVEVTGFTAFSKDNITYSTNTNSDKFLRVFIKVKTQYNEVDSSISLDFEKLANGKVKALTDKVYVRETVLE